MESSASAGRAASVLDPRRRGADEAVGLLAVLLSPLTSSTLTATAVLAGVAIGECAQSIVVGPIVADLAPPHLFGRYMSLYGLSFTAGVALGPAVGGARAGAAGLA